MTGPSTSGITSTINVTNFPAVITPIYESALKMQYEANLTRHLCKKIGAQGQGGWIHYPYFDPSTFATAASTLTEANDFTTYQQLVNASVIIAASEFGEAAFLTDRAREAAKVNLDDETGRQLGIGIARKLDLHILAAMSAGFTTGTVTGTNSTNGFGYSHYAAAQSKLAAKALTVPGTYKAVVPEYSWFYTAKSTFSETYAAAMGDPGKEVLQKFYIRRLLGNIDVFRMPLSLVSATSLAAGYVFASEGVGLWIDRDLKVETERDASKRGDEIIATLRAGAKVLIGGYGVRLKMYANAPTP
jgi:hypothetical protein